MIRKALTENGWVKGLQGTNARITVYKGVPFAAPPVGENRWRAPQPAANWEGERPCFEFAPISMQEIPGLADNVYSLEWHVNPDIPMSEDCLYLNIWTPAKTPDEKLPVLVWYFGGGFQVGYTAEMEFDGEALAKRGIVVVTVNYRVGAFGFMGHKDLTAAQPDAPTNFGLLDQQAGLRWVNRNIAAFGGDPDNISIAGQSAGGGSVMYQVTCMQNEGLIKKALSMSGMFRSPYGAGFGGVRTLADNEEAGAKFLAYCGANTIEEARKLDAEFIRAKYEEYRSGSFVLGPCVDGLFSTDDAYRLLAENKCLQIPLMAGNTVDEFGAFIPAADEAELAAKAKEIFGDDAETFLSFEEAKAMQEPGHYAHISNIEYAVKNVFLEAAANGRTAPSYYYRFNEDIPGFDNPGNFHSVDLWFFFDNLQKCWRPFVGRHYDLAREIADYWVNFIKTGDPNGIGSDEKELPVWKPYTEEARCGMVWDEKGSTPEDDDTPFAKFIIDHIS